MVSEVPAAWPLLLPPPACCCRRALSIADWLVTMSCRPELRRARAAASLSFLLMNLGCWGARHRNREQRGTVR